MQADQSNGSQDCNGKLCFTSKQVCLFNSTNADVIADLMQRS